MDLLAHALYGATVCSRAGLAGGRTGARERRWYREPTVWWAVLFGWMPDILSMWVPFAAHTLSAAPDHFFRAFDGGWLEVYRLAHSLLAALAASGLLFLLYRPSFVPSLAWAVHIVCDAASHGEGKFQTLPFYPLSDWGIVGIPFWRHPRFVAAYWALLVAVWAILFLWRAGARTAAPCGADGSRSTKGRGACA